MRITNEFVFFWQDEDYLSNFYPSPFTIDGIEFSCNEQWFMYSKAKLFGDLSSMELILKETVPLKIKWLGRAVIGFEEQQWATHREDIMKVGLLEKFQQNSRLKSLLEATGTREIVEASPFDKVWGVGMAQDHPCIENRRKWKGQNLLGIALVKVREQLLNLK